MESLGNKLMIRMPQLLGDHLINQAFAFIDEREYKTAFEFLKLGLKIAPSDIKIDRLIKERKIQIERILENLSIIENKRQEVEFLYKLLAFSNEDMENSKIFSVLENFKLSDGNDYFEEYLNARFQYFRGDKDKAIQIFQSIPPSEIPCCELWAGIIKEEIIPRTGLQNILNAYLRDSTNAYVLSVLKKYSDKFFQDNFIRIVDEYLDGSTLINLFIYNYMDCEEFENEFLQLKEAINDDEIYYSLIDRLVQFFRANDFKFKDLYTVVNDLGNDIGTDEFEHLESLGYLDYIRMEFEVKLENPADIKNIIRRYEYERDEWKSLGYKNEYEHKLYRGKGGPGPTIFIFPEEDDEPSTSKYGGYNGWNDDIIDSAFNGDPESTWNVD